VNKSLPELARILILSILALSGVAVWCAIIVGAMLAGSLPWWIPGMWVVVTVGGALIGMQAGRHCEHCGRFSRNVRRRRLNTAYVDEESNWLFGCLECYDRATEYFEQLWDEYYFLVK